MSRAVFDDYGPYRGAAADPRTPEPPDGMEPCPRCDGTGKRNSYGDDCRACGGLGVVDMTEVEDE